MSSGKLVALQTAGQGNIFMLGARDMSGIVAHNLSGLRCHQEVTNETYRMATGDPEDAI